ncbi:MAG: hypothetical protein AAFV53_23875 [Myxococcota bacterium]
MTSPSDTHGSVLLLHGLESAVDDDLVPIGRKAVFLRERYDTITPGLDTRAAIAHRDHCVANRTPWMTEPARVQTAFAAPMANARAALTDDVRLIVGSSFGGAVLLKMLHEEPCWTGPCVFLAGAGLKLTHHTTLPPGCQAILIHGRADDVVDLEDSRKLAATGGPGVQLWEVGDGHRLHSVLEDGTLVAAIELLLSRTPTD